MKILKKKTQKEVVDSLKTIDLNRISSSFSKQMNKKNISVLYMILNNVENKYSLIDNVYSNRLFPTNIDSRLKIEYIYRELIFISLIKRHVKMLELLKNLSDNFYILLLSEIYKISNQSKFLHDDEYMSFIQELIKKGMIQFDDLYENLKNRYPIKTYCYIV